MRRRKAASIRCDTPRHRRRTSLPPRSACAASVCAAQDASAAAHQHAAPCLRGDMLPSFRPRVTLNAAPAAQHETHSSRNATSRAPERYAMSQQAFAGSIYAAHAQRRVATPDARLRAFISGTPPPDAAPPLRG